MNINEFKKAISKGAIEAHILVNQGGIYLIQASHNGKRVLLTEKKSSRPTVFKGLSECYEMLASVGLNTAFVDQSVAHCEIISQQDCYPSLVDRRIVHF